MGLGSLEALLSREQKQHKHGCHEGGRWDIPYPPVAKTDSLPSSKEMHLFKRCVSPRESATGTTF